MAADHDRRDWRMLRPLTADWKERVRPILHLTKTAPGRMIEEKEFSLAWHYRRADPGSLARAKELLDDLAEYTRNIDVQVLEGNKVIEIRNTGINKGTRPWNRSPPERRSSFSALATTGRMRIFSGRCRRRPGRCGSAWRTPPPASTWTVTLWCGWCFANCAKSPAKGCLSQRMGPALRVVAAVLAGRTDGEPCELAATTVKVCAPTRLVQKRRHLRSPCPLLFRHPTPTG